MPNSPRGGGISRKITSAADRKRLKEITAELEIPQGMGLIVRTAGANRPKPEIKRDCEYLMRLWDDIREHTLRSVAPALIYEEASLIKRAIRDVYSRDIDEIIVDGEEGWRGAHDFMRMLMPSHASKVQLWRDGRRTASRCSANTRSRRSSTPCCRPTVQLKSGGYLVINQTEALVAIDVNSGRSTRERGIEETALRTNLEAADEVARQLRLRDLAGLIVIDFIDMESKKNNAAVERRLKEALKIDRARIQVGHISHFGLLEMSRQRLRPSPGRDQLHRLPALRRARPCPQHRKQRPARAARHRGRGRQGPRQPDPWCTWPSAVIMYVLNHKRDRLAEIEARYRHAGAVRRRRQLVPPQVRIERLRAQLPESERPAPVVPAAPAPVLEAPDADPARPRRHRGRRRGPGARGGGQGRAGARRRNRARRATAAAGAGGGGAAAATAPPAARRVRPRTARTARKTRRPSRHRCSPTTPSSRTFRAAPSRWCPSRWKRRKRPSRRNAEPATAAEDEAAGGEESEQARRRRGRRGGRRRRRDETEATAEAPEPAPLPLWTGPTPADPFGGQTYDIFDLIEQQEQERPVAPLPCRRSRKRSPPNLSSRRRNCRGARRNRWSVRR